MIAWPASLPEFVLKDGYGETFHDQIVRSETDSGATKQRRRFTARFDSQDWSLAMTEEQVVTFENFYYNTLSGGSLTFTAPHPRTRTIRSWSIITAPRVSSGQGEEYRVSFRVELKP